jgi:transcriptional regulator with XRE-family HTH domain
LKTVNDPNYRQFVARLRQARESANLSQDELALRLRKTQTFVSKIETAQRTLDLLDFLRWAKETNVDELELLQELSDLFHGRRQRVRIKPPKRS